MKSPILFNVQSSDSARNILEIALGFEQRQRIYICYLAAFLIPIKLSLSYLIICPALLLFLLSTFRDNTQIQLPRAYSSFLLFLGFAFFSSLFGVDPLHSLAGILKLIFWSLLVPYILSVLTGLIHFLKISICLLTAQCLAAVHSILESGFNTQLPRIFLGSVTESGQLALSLPFALGLFFFCTKYSRSSNDSSRQWVRPLLMTSALLALGFCQKLNIPFIVSIFFGTSLTFYIANRIRVLFKEIVSPGLELQSLSAFLAEVILPLLVVALLANLKRGPWIASLLACLFLLLSFRRRQVLPLLVMLILLFAYFDPLLIRLSQSLQDFFISGGRWSIWQVGLEFTGKFPLGIGFDNSGFLREFSAEIPDSLSHFHNNFLNILVETGWIGLLLYLSWLWNFFHLGFLRHTDSEIILQLSTGSALLSWQIAGFFEYNVGDSEVLLVAFLMIALLISVTSHGQAWLRSFSERAQSNTHAVL